MKKDLKICCISSHGGHLHEMMGAMEGIKGNIVWLTHKTKASQVTLEGKNPNCQRNHLPLRFRDLMTEFQ